MRARGWTVNTIQLKLREIELRRRYSRYPDQLFKLLIEMSPTKKPKYDERGLWRIACETELSAHIDYMPQDFLKYLAEFNDRSFTQSGMFSNFNINYIASKHQSIYTVMGIHFIAAGLAACCKNVKIATDGMTTFEKGILVNLYTAIAGQPSSGKSMQLRDLVIMPIKKACGELGADPDNVLKIKNAADTTSKNCRI